MPTLKQPAKAPTSPQTLTAAKRKRVPSGAKAPARTGSSTAGLKPRPFKATVQSSRAGGERRPRHKKTAKPLAPERVAAILAGLRTLYPDVVCALTHKNAFELVIATALSAQTTDVNVNKVTPELFRRFPTPKALAAASLPEIEEIIHSTGFYKSKAKNIKGAAKILTERFIGKVPETIEELVQLPGVARKTANVVLGSWFGIPSGVVVDTHVLRLSKRLELTKHDDPVKVEMDLQKVIPQDRWIQLSHELIHHGRQVCVARKPKCADCLLEPVCNAVDKTWSSAEAATQ